MNLISLRYLIQIILISSLLLHYDTTKTELGVFTRRYQWNRNCNLILSGERLWLDSETKYLTFTLDSKLGLHM